ncbi:hypothetical protein UXO11_22675 [Enterobacter wuhouensis]|uniref:hypothetical protein n=1 Tax=Enterobacter wuhouensis TaxID=2529381 RepID=UPI002FD1881B
MFYAIVGSVPVALLLYCPLMTLISFITPWKGFRTSTVRRKNRFYTTLHLSIYDRVGHLNLRRAARFHRSFLSTLERALHQNAKTVFFTSHLMRPAHMKTMTALLKSMEDTHRWHCRDVTIPLHIRNGIRLQIFIQEWRRITVPKTGVLVVIRPRKGV